MTVVEDAEEQITLFIPAGAHWMAPFRNGKRLKIQEAEYELIEQPYKAHVLSFAWPGNSAAVLLFYGSDWSPSHWYVNLEEPLRRSPVGFDTLDHKLDVIVELDGSWRWKDEDQLVDIIERGLLDPQEESVCARRPRSPSAGSPNASRPSTATGSAGDQTPRGPCPLCRRDGTACERSGCRAAGVPRG